MIKHLPFILALFLLQSLNTGAQEYYNKRPEYLKANSVWVWGAQKGLDFNQNPPKSFTSIMIPNGGSASVASRYTGQLLFYTEGRKVYTRNHTIMPNGTLNTKDVTSPQQGVCIVPFLNDNSKYYIFIVEREARNNTGRLSYTVVDSALNGGLGDVVVSQKNIPIDSGFAGTLLAVPSDDGNVWLIAHKRDSAIFHSYRITATGIDTKPVISKAGTQIEGPDLFLNSLKTMFVGAYSYAMMAISPNRKMLAISSSAFYNMYTGNNLTKLQGMMICKFDACSGVISDALLVDSAIGSYNGFAFSPDNSKLYLSADMMDSAQLYIAQYDLAVMEANTIRNSAVVISGPNGWTGGDLKLYNDTIYTWALNGNKRRLARICKPNEKGAASLFQDTVATLDLGKTGNDFDMPNAVVFPVPLSDTIRRIVMDTLVCDMPDPIQLNVPEGYTNYWWNDASNDTILSVKEKGIFWVLASDGCYAQIDTFKIGGEDIIPVVIATDDDYTLGTTASYKTWQWYKDGSLIPGAMDSSYTISENGTYSVVVTNELGCSDSGSYVVTNVYVEDIPAGKNGIQIYPNPARDYIYIKATQKVNVSLSGVDGKVIARQNNTKKVSLSGLNSGLYFIYIYDSTGSMLYVDRLVIR